GRLYVESGGRDMPATMMCQADTATPKTTPVTFILAGHRLVTVRYDEPRPFTLISNKLGRLCSATINGEGVMMELLDAAIDRLADILERIGGGGDQGSRAIFGGGGAGGDPTRAPQHIPQSNRARAGPYFHVGRAARSCLA